MGDFSRFANFAKGVFYTCATVLMVGAAYIIYTEWQDYWSEGFKDFRSISEAIVELQNTARPISDIAPQMYAQMAEMNRTIIKMEASVRQMGAEVHGINQSVYGMSYTVPQRMDGMRDQMNPWNMMNPFQ